MPYVYDTDIFCAFCEIFVSWILYKHALYCTWLILCFFVFYLLLRLDSMGVQKKCLEECLEFPILTE